jgi:hypothetical protein
LRLSKGAAPQQQKQLAARELVVAVGAPATTNKKIKNEKNCMPPLLL